MQLGVIKHLSIHLWPSKLYHPTCTSQPPQGVESARESLEKLAVRLWKARASQVGVIQMKHVNSRIIGIYRPISWLVMVFTEGHLQPLALFLISYKSYSYLTRNPIYQGCPGASDPRIRRGKAKSQSPSEENKSMKNDNWKFAEQFGKSLDTVIILYKYFSPDSDSYRGSYFQ